MTDQSEVEANKRASEAPAPTAKSIEDMLDNPPISDPRVVGESFDVDNLDNGSEPFYVTNEAGEMVTDPNCAWAELNPENMAGYQVPVPADADDVSSEPNADLGDSETLIDESATARPTEPQGSAEKAGVFAASLLSAMSTGMEHIYNVFVSLKLEADFQLTLFLLTRFPQAYLHWCQRLSDNHPGRVRALVDFSAVMMSMTFLFAAGVLDPNAPVVNDVRVALHSVNLNSFIQVVSAREANPTPFVVPSTTPNYIPTPALLATPTGIPSLENEGVYIVQPGQNLSQIAEQNNTTVLVLQQLNGLADPNFIQIGQKIKLPKE